MSPPSPLSLRAPPTSEQSLGQKGAQNTLPHLQPCFPQPSTPGSQSVVLLAHTHPGAPRELQASKDGSHTPQVLQADPREFLQTGSGAVPPPGAQYGAIAEGLASGRDRVPWC